MINCTGPDGRDTLCSSCYKRYRACKLRLYRTRSGRITVCRTATATPMVATGFPYSKGSHRDVSRPSVRVATESEHAALPSRKRGPRVQGANSSYGGMPSTSDAFNYLPSSSTFGLARNALHGCASCGTLGGTPNTGPDGPRTLCAECGSRYQNLRLRLYRLMDGRITAEPSTRASRVRAVGFEANGLHTDWRKPRVRDATKAQHSSLARRDKICLSCRKKVELIATGPDGYRTLCQLCGNRYYRQELCVFRLPDGRVSVLCRPGAERVIVVGFERSAPHKPGRYDVRFPIVRDALPGEHAKHHPGENDICGLRTVQKVTRRGDSDEVEEDEEEEEIEGERESSEEEEGDKGNSNGEENNGMNAYLAQSRRWNEGEDEVALITRSTANSFAKIPGSVLGFTRVAAKDAEEVRLQRGNELSFIVKAACSYGWETSFRYIYVAYGVTVSSFYQVLKEAFRMDAAFSICYKDDDGDLIHVIDNADMAPMFALARRGEGALQVQLRPP